MSINSYQLFVTIVERGTLAAAAHELKLSPSAVSHALASFESQLGFALFLRGRNGIKITKGGEAILPAARAVLSAHNSLLQQAAQIVGLEVGSVCIGALSSVCAAWIPDIVRSFTELYPNISVSIEQGGLEDVCSWILSGKVDLGFMTAPVVPGIEAVEICTDPLVCIAPKGYLPGLGGVMAVSELKTISLISQRGDYGRDIRRLLESHGIVVNSQMQAIDSASIIAMVESGLGVAVLPKLALSRYKYDLDIYDFHPPEVRQIMLGCLGLAGLPPAGKRMHEHILSISLRQ